MALVTSSGIFPLILSIPCLNAISRNRGAIQWHNFGSCQSHISASGHIPHVNVADSSAVLFCPIHWNMVLRGKNDEQPLIPALEIQCYELLGCRVNLPTSSWVALGAK